MTEVSDRIDLAELVQDIFQFFGTWKVGGVPVITWIIALCIISIIGIFVKGNK